MIPLNANSNVDNSDLTNYPGGRIKDNDGTGNGTGVNRSVYGDLHSTISKLMRLYAINPNGLPDNETNGFQIIDSLRGLASKNDFIYPLSTNGTVLSVDIKLSQMLDNEYVLCLAAFNKGSETQIKGIGVGSFSITYSGNFKANEYVRVIKTSGGVSIIREADALSLNSMVAELLFLKKASQSEEDDGTIDTVATTPLVNKTTFIKRVIGVDSVNFLASLSRNGLYPKEHFSIVNSLGNNRIRNIGGFSGLEVGVSFGAMTSFGSITLSNAIYATDGLSIVRCTMDNDMDNTNYKVFISIESNIGFDQSSYILCPLFVPLSTTQFDFAIRESSGASQNLKVHFDVIQL